MSRQYICLLASILFFSLFGCKYKDGLTEQSKVFSVSLDIKNNSKAIQLSPMLHRIIKDQFIRNPQIKIVNSDFTRPDYSIEIIIANYDTKPESFLDNDTLLANSFKANFEVYMNVYRERSNQLELRKKYLFTTPTTPTNFDHQDDNQLQVSFARDLSQRLSRDLLVHLR